MILSRISTDRRLRGLSWLHGLSLRTGLAVGFIAMIVLTGFVAIVALLAQEHSIRAVDKLLEVDGRIVVLSASSTIAMLKARRAEKDFLLFRREFGFDEAKSRYATLLRISLAEIRQNMAEVRTLDGDPGTAERTQAVERAVARYEQGFLRIVELYGTLGYVSTGFEGQMREAAHRIEAIVIAEGEIRLLADLLSLRRHEKDFIARGLDKYAEAFAKGVDQFKADVAAARLSSPRKAELLVLAGEYARSFEQYAHADAGIDADAEVYLAAAHSVEPLVDDLQVGARRREIATRSEAEQTAQLATWTICVSAFIALLVGATVAQRVSGAITGALGESLDFANRVAGGDLTARLTPAGRNEFGALAGALNRMTEALQERDAGLGRAQRMAKLSHVITGPDGAFERWSNTLPQLIGVEPGAMPQSTRAWLDIVHPDDRTRFRATAIEAGAKGTRAEIEYRLRRGDGAWVEIRQVLEPLEGHADPRGRMRWFNTLQDITERRIEQRKIERLNRVYAVLSGINGAIVRIRDRDELYWRVCEIAAEAGKFPAVWVGTVDRVNMLVKPVAWRGPEAGIQVLRALRFSVHDDPAEERNLLAEVFATKKAVISNDVLADPRTRYKKEMADLGIRAAAFLPLLVDDEVAAIFSLYSREAQFFDDTEAKLMLELAGDLSFALAHIANEEKLNYLALYDSLTGLANRALILERLKQNIHAAEQAGSKVALVLADIERLRTVNESLGRQAGDALLKQAAERLSQAAGASDIGRIGADHFAVVLPSVKGRSEVVRTFETLSRDWLAKPFHLNDTEVRVSAKAGIVLFPNDGGDADMLLRNAEAALARAKDSGERHAFYVPALTRHTAERLALENRLRQALEKDEFVLHYQPKVDLVTRRIVGAEALIRWQNPQLGLVPPADFIPLMEETGLILEAGAWALARAAADHLRWVESGLAAPRVAVNVSAIQLRKAEFVASVKSALEGGATPPGIDLEITESLVMEDIEGNIRKLKQVRALGLDVAIDDFGTGYSSLGYLAKLPAQSLKIDRSFIIEMLNDPDTLTLVRTIISLAQSLKLKVVAEGVDSEEQARFLHLLRCDEMQGYLFSKPLPFDAMAALLTKATAKEVA